jgi:hypothetical protein
MSETPSGHRAFPPEIANPTHSTFLTQDEFDGIEKQKLQEAPSACPGHAETVVWYAGQRGYIIQVSFDDKPDVFATSLCTFTPTFGMDQIDGLFAQDIEEFILQRELGHPTERLNVFEDRPSIPTETYLRSRGVLK